MTITVALVLGLLVGASLGALGGGGSVLTVPALVYLLDQTPQAAITGSLIVVGLTAAAGTLPHAHAGHVAWTRGLLFGALGTGGSLAGSHLAAALDPDLLLVLFSLLMLTVAVLLLRQSERAAPRPVMGERSGVGSGCSQYRWTPSVRPRDTRRRRCARRCSYFPRREATTNEPGRSGRWVAPASPS